MINLALMRCFRTDIDGALVPVGDAYDMDISLGVGNYSNDEACFTVDIVRLDKSGGAVASEDNYYPKSDAEILLQRQLRKAINTALEPLKLKYGVTLALGLGFCSDATGRFNLSIKQLNKGDVGLSA